MDTKKLWYELYLPVLLRYLKDKKVEMESVGTIPTLEALIEELENENN